jgi:hypothetical protein
VFDVMYITCSVHRVHELDGLFALVLCSPTQHAKDFMASLCAPYVHTGRSCDPITLPVRVTPPTERCTCLPPPLVKPHFVQVQ